MRTELMSCPFCGSKVMIHRISDWDYMGEKKLFGIKCKCGVWLIENGEGAQNTIANMWNTRTDGWISVNDRLPEPRQKVLVYRPDAVQGNDPVIDIIEYIGKIGSYGHRFERVWEPTHWQPLPDIPIDKR